MCLKQIKKHLPCLTLLANKNISKGLKKVLLSDVDVVYAILECSHNYLKGNIPSNKTRQKKIKNFKRHLEYLADNTRPIKTKQRQLIRQKGNGFLSLLLGPVVSLISSLFTK